MLQQMTQGAEATPQVQQQAIESARSFVNAIREDRQSLFGKDLVRTFLLIAAAGGLIYFFIQKKLKPTFVIVGILLLSSFDLFAVGRRYFNERNFVEAETFEGVFTPTQADIEIKKDNSYFRVFNQTTNAFNESTTSYFHNSIGGYNPAKLMLYQDLIENQLSKGNMQVYNMLNTKYFITPGPNNQPVAQLNPAAFGPCWLVKGVKFVPNGIEEMAALSTTNLRDTAVVQEKFKSKVHQIQPDSSASIQLIANINDSIRYHYSSSTPQFAVFSEVYYSAGWNAYIDGKKADYTKVNYVLRGLSIPAGNHEVKFLFEPQIYFVSNTVTFWAYIVLYLLVIGAILYYVRRFKKPTTNSPVKHSIS
jgi:hypothetical protein